MSIVQVIEVVSDGTSVQVVDVVDQSVILSVPEGMQGPKGVKGDTGDVTPAALAAKMAAEAAQLAAETAQLAAETAETNASGSASDALAAQLIAEQAAASVDSLTVGTTTTGAPGSAATVADTGTPGHPVLAFAIPRGDVGAAGADGAAGATGATGPTGATGATGPAGAVTGQVIWFDNTASDLTMPSITGTVYAAVNSNPDTITRSSGSFVTDGFVAGQKIVTSGFANGANNGTFVVTVVAAGTLTLATIHALTAEAAGAAVTIRQDRERITRAPASGTQQDESVSIVVADGDVTIDSYLTPSGYPGSLAIPAGEWRFHAWSYVSAGATTTIKFRVIKVSSTGVETTLFTTSASAAIASTSVSTPTEVQLSYTVAADIALATTDRIVVRVIGNNSSATARVLHFVYQGATFASHVETTLTVAGVGVPVGGATGLVLGKKSASDYDTEWVASPSGLIVPQSQVTGLTAALANKLTSADLPALLGPVPAGAATWSPQPFNVATIAPAIGTIIYTPLPVATAFTLTGLTIEVTAGVANGVVAVGLYADNGYLPSTLIADLGTVEGATAAVKAITGLSVSVPKGIVWVGVLPLAAASAITFRTVVGSLVALPAAPLASGTRTCTVYSTVSQTALPSPAGTVTFGNTFLPLRVWMTK
jgi:hypothetical protein